MQDNQELAIDLPMKLLIFENEEGKMMLTRNLTSWLKDRYELKAEEAASMLEKKVKGMVQETIS